MKAIYTTVFFLIVSIYSMGQTLQLNDGNSATNLNYLDGKLGIGISSPESLLHLIQTSEDYSSGIKIVGNSSAISGRIWMCNEVLHLDNATSGAKTGFSLLKNGRIGIGTSLPNAKLHIPNGDVIIGGSSDQQNVLNSTLFIKSKSETAYTFYVGHHNSGSDLFWVNGSGKSYLRGNLGIGESNPESKLHINQLSETYSSGIKIVGSSSPISGRIWMCNEKLHLDNATAGAQTGLTLLKDGTIGIGTTKSNGYKLAVSGTIGAREIVVNTDVWSDFVFHSDYRLKSLDEVELFIKQNNHLPDIPSEQDVKEKGINLGDMDAKLLQKIEELTLYVIQINKENKELRKEIDELKKK